MSNEFMQIVSTRGEITKGMEPVKIMTIHLYPEKLQDELALISKNAVASEIGHMILNFKEE